MKMSDFEVLKNNFEAASKILSDKYELELWTAHFKNVIKGDRCVYVRSKDSRRYPSPEEIKKAGLELELHAQKIQSLEVQFAAL